MALAHIAEIVAATDLPVNADYESGYAHDPEGVAFSVARCVETGVAGLSIEDSTGDPDKPLYDLSLGVERIKAARAAIDASGADVLLTGRAECYLVGHPDPMRGVDPPPAGLCGGRAPTFSTRRGRASARTSGPSCRPWRRSP
jgi:2-methylisocitrate lyase-like PEP mutase family enzyme